MRETENNKRYKAAMQGVGMQNVKMQQEAADKGSLQVNVTSSVNSYPISEARISISYTGVPENTLEQLVTDSSGQTDMIELDAPPEEWSLDPENERQPYSEYTLNVSAPGFEPVSIAGTEILANTKAIQNIRMRPTDTGREEEEIFVIPAQIAINAVFQFRALQNTVRFLCCGRSGILKIAPAGIHDVLYGTKVFLHFAPP